jgi:ABC-type sugar transport system permease subunit
MTGAGIEHDERRTAYRMVAPALAVIAIGGLLPIVMTAWEAMHGHDLRLPWLGRPFVGLDNFAEAAGDSRFRAALLHTALFTLITVPVELAIGLALAQVMHAGLRGRALIRTTLLLPWAIPTVVAALLWRFMFDAQAGVLAALLEWVTPIDAGFDWFVHPLAAWVPIAAADIWKTTPFVAILLLAGLQAIDPTLYEAARIDGASAWRRFTSITLPLLAPSLVIAAAFRALEALRLFDLVYVMTGGGPGTATETLSLHAFIVLMQRLRFGYGSALSMLVFALAFAASLVWVRALGRSFTGERA